MQSVKSVVLSGRTSILDEKTSKISGFSQKQRKGRIYTPQGQKPTKKERFDQKLGKTAKTAVFLFFIKFRSKNHQKTAKKQQKKGQKTTKKQQKNSKKREI